MITERGQKEFGDCDGIQVWTNSGWKNIMEVVRHKIEKKKAFLELGPNLLLLMLQNITV